MTTIREISVSEGIPESTIRAWIKSGKLKAIRPGKKKVYVEASDWQEFKRKCKLPVQQDEDVRSVLRSLFARKTA